MATIKELRREKARSLIQKEIDRAIENGTMKLPSENEMVESMGISRVSIRSALAELEMAGKIIRIQGKGTFVNKNICRFDQDINRAKSYDQARTSDGSKIELDILLLEVIETPDFLKTERGFMKDMVIKSPKIYTSNGQIVAFCVDYLPIDYYYELEELKNYKESIFKYLYKYHNLVIKYGKMDIESVSKDEFKKEAGDYEVADSLLKISSLDYNQFFLPVIYTIEYINTRLIKFNGVRYRDIDYEKYEEEQ